ncbi:hypothetical protein NQ786_18500 [Acinetobacter baumannii]|nr:hypothetical protein [Acinetobacter baumannii]
MSTDKISYKQATDLAKQNLVDLVENVKEITVEGIELTDKYEVTLSYIVDNNSNGDSSGLSSIAQIMGRRREKKLFNISDDGKFLGFKDAKKADS